MKTFPMLGFSQWRAAVRHTPCALAAAIAALLLLLAPAAHAQTIDATTSWLGNSFPGTPVSNEYNTVNGTPAHVQQDIQAMYVTPDGSCYTDTTWDEAGQNGGIYSNGQINGNCTDLHGFGRNGGSAIFVDSNYVYVAMTQTGDDCADICSAKNSNNQPEFPPANNIWYCVRRYDRHGNPVSYLPSSGDGSELIINSGSRSGAGAPYSNLPVGGIAEDANYLYVSDPGAGQIKEYPLSNLSNTPSLTWNLSNPGTMVVANGYLYVAQTGAHKILKYNSAGTLQATITLASSVVPSALAYDSYNGANLLLVTDQGPDQNVKEYNLGSLAGSPTTIAATFGTTSGIYAGTGAQIGTVGPLRFNNLTGVGVDASGNIYVSEDGTCYPGYGGGAVIDSYTSSGTRNWHLSCEAFVDCADIDPSSETDVFSKDKHWTMNYGNQFPYTPTPGSEATYSGYTINRFKYPQDLRLHVSLIGPANTTSEGHAWIREFQGHKFMITTDQQCQYLGIYRFNSSTDGECAIPSVIFCQTNQAGDSTGWPENQPSSGEWIWRDANGNGTLDGGTKMTNSDGTTDTGEFDQPSQFNTVGKIWGFWVDSNGDVWEASTLTGSGQYTVYPQIRHFVLQGLDAQGNPIYNYSHMSTLQAPSQFTDLRRIEYYPATGTMYLSGYNSTYPNSLGDWGGMGRVVCRYDNWTYNQTTPHLGYPITLTPWQSGENTAAMSATGQFLFVTYFLPNQISVYNADTGALTGTIYPGTAVGGTGGPQSGQPYPLGGTDIRYGVRAYERSNGEYIIFNEDDLLGKIVMYRWTPTFRITNDWQSPDCLNIDSGALGCSADSNISSWNTLWVEEPGLSGTFRLRTLNSGGQYINVQNGALQYSAANPNATTSMWGLQDNDGTHNYIYSLSNTQDYINTETGLTCGPINGGWTSSLWLFQELN